MYSPRTSGRLNPLEAVFLLLPGLRGCRRGEEGSTTFLPRTRSCILAGSGSALDLNVALGFSRGASPGQRMAVVE